MTLIEKILLSKRLIVKIYIIYSMCHYSKANTKVVFIEVYDAEHEENHAFSCQ